MWDFCCLFGIEKVGLVIGDIFVNWEVLVLVMIIEIFCNMLYGIFIGEIGIFLEKVEVVVLDECYYMNDW